MTRQPRDPQRHTYQIRVRGHLEPAMLRDTLLSGDLPDQAALYGLLHQIEALGLELPELRHLPG